MANAMTINVRPEFQIAVFADRLARTYQQKGYTVSVTMFENQAILNVEKGVGGINTLLGLGEGVRVTCAVVNQVLTVNYSDEEWTGKIIGFVIGFLIPLLFYVPAITAAVGTYKQIQLPKAITADATFIAASM